MIKFTVLLTEKEHECLKQKAEVAGLTMGPFIRKLIEETEIKARPPDEYVQLIREINAIGNNINQIAHIANAESSISKEKILKVLQYQNDLIRLVRGLR